MIRLSAVHVFLFSAFLRSVYCSNPDYADSLLCYECPQVYASSLSAARAQCSVDDSTYQPIRMVSCPRGYSCYISSYDGEGMVAFKRSCSARCSTGCQSQTCMYCCDSNICNGDDSKLPTASSRLSPTEIMSIAGGAVIGIIVILGIVTLVVRRRAYRRYNQRFRSSNEEYDDVDSDQRELLTGSERVRAGMPPTYNEAMEAPPPYEPKSDDGVGEDNDEPPAFEGVLPASDESGTDTAPSTSTETLNESTGRELD